MSQIFKKKGIWLGHGTKPKVGDLVVFDWRRDGWSDHTGIVEKVVGNQITVIEGNINRRVGYRLYKYNDWQIAGYARPKYPSGQTTPQNRLSNDDLAREVIQGKWGNGDVRKTSLTRAGYNPAAVQQSVNRLVKASKQSLKSNQEIAKEVVKGKWGNGDARKTRLTQAGYNYQAIQKLVNQLI